MWQLVWLSRINNEAKIPIFLDPDIELSWPEDSCSDVFDNWGVLTEVSGVYSDSRAVLTARVFKA